jgi:hypothetical protein
MDDTPCCRFFLEPACPPQRQYEALRALFLDRCRQKDVAERFGYDYDAFGQLVGQFRARCADGQPPPFSGLPLRAALRASRRGRIVELRGPLGPGGTQIYRVRVRRKPTPVYIELREDQRVPIPAG